MAESSIADGIKQLEQADYMIEKVKADTALVSRISRIAELLRTRAAAGDFNCICTGATRANTINPAG